MATDVKPFEAAPAESSDDKIMGWARQRAEAIQGLYIHLLVFLVVNGGLVAINWLTRGDDGGWWFQWTLLPWGIGLLVHVLVTVAPVFSPQWVDRRAERIASRRRADINR